MRYLVGVLDEGRLVASDRPEIVARSTNPLVRRLLGELVAHGVAHEIGLVVDAELLLEGLVGEAVVDADPDQLDALRLDLWLDLLVDRELVAADRAEIERVEDEEDLAAVLRLRVGHVRHRAGRETQGHGAAG